MRAMKDSGIEWIGKIPQDWQIAKVKHVYSFQTGWTPSTSNAAYFDGDLPWANISDIGKTKTIYDTAKHITEEAVANSSMGISPKGSLMYSFKLSVGDVSFCGTDMYTNEAIATFLPSDKYDLRYLYYAAPLFIIKNANENIYGAKLLNQELIRNALILNPPYNEQVSVADYLDAKCAEIDALIAAKEKTNALLKERRQSIIYEAVTKGLNSDAPMKDSGVEWIGEIPENWCTAKVKYTGSYRSGNTITAADIKETGSFPVYGGNGLRGYTEETTHEGEHLLIGRQGALCGNVHMVSGKFWASEHAVVGTINERFNIRYLFYVLDVFGLNRLSTSAAQPGISVEQITGVVIPFPSREEQQKVAKYLDERCYEVDELVYVNEASIQKLKEYRQSIIYEAVTGKIEV